MAPGSSAGSSPLANAVLLPAMISACVLPARAISVRLYVVGKTDRAAGGLKQIGPRTLGFQNSGASGGDIQPRSTTHTNPFLPATAVSYPCCPKTKTVASCEMDSGAALRAKAISAFRSAIRYSPTGAMFAYLVLASWERISGASKTMLKASVRMISVAVRDEFIFSSVWLRLVPGLVHSRYFLKYVDINLSKKV